MPARSKGSRVGGLAGHLYTSARRLEQALDQPMPASPVVVGLAEYYGINRIGQTDDLGEGLHPIIRMDGEQRADVGAESLATRFAELVARLEARLPEEPPDRLIPVVRVADGVTPLDDYLATRVVELVVHSDDVAASAGRPALTIPSVAASVAIELFVTLARARSGDVEVIRAFTRQERAVPGVLRVL